MKKAISIILAVMVVCVLGVSLVACGDDPPKAYEQSMTAEEVENFLFGRDGAVNFASRVFNVKAVYSGYEGVDNFAGESILILDETNGVNFATVYDNVTEKDGDGEVDNRTAYIFIKWSEKNGAMKNEGVVHAFSNDGGTPQYATMKSGYEGIHNNVLSNCGIHAGRKLLENHIHNSNDDIIDTIVYTGKTYYHDEAKTNVSKVEIVLTYHYVDDGRTIYGTATLVLEKKTVKINNGSEVEGIVFTSMDIVEDGGNNLSITYTYNVDTIDLPDLDNIQSTWPDAYPIA